MTGHTTTFGGWLLYLLWGLAIASAAGALFVIVDAVRRPPERFRSAIWRLVWAVPQAIYVALFALAFIPSLSARLAGVIAVLLLPAVLAQAAYLLRVVWPSPKRLAAIEAETAEDADADVGAGELR